MSASAGRVLLMDKGNYAAATQYVPLDVVKHQNGVWLCKKAALGVAPTEGEYWTKWLESARPMVGATASVDGKAGLVPKPVAGDDKKALFGDGTFKEVKSSALSIDNGYVAIDYSILS